MLENDGGTTWCSFTFPNLLDSSSIYYILTQTHIPSTKNWKMFTHWRCFCHDGDHEGFRGLCPRLATESGVWTLSTGMLTPSRLSC